MEIPMTRSRVLSILFAMGLCAGIWVACGGGGGGSSAAATMPTNSTPPANHVWVGQNGSMSFNPPTLTVSQGVAVTWDFMGGTHDVTSGTADVPDGAFASGAPQTSGTFVHSFNTKGTFHYYCSVHGSSMMSGTITVN